MPDTDDFIDRNDALAVLAVMGDLSMGQPIDHSMRVADLSAALARQLGWDDIAVAQVRQVALLRWSGCTANAPDIAATLSDDVHGRAAMLALQFDKITLLVPPQDIAAHATLSASIHCEVSSLVAESLGLDGGVVAALGCVFEHWDGSGRPNGYQGSAIPASAMVASMCSELEVLSRTHGLARALQMLRQRAGVVYPAPMVDCAEAHAANWLAALVQSPRPWEAEDDQQALRRVGMGLIGHVIDLKLPWLTNQSRAVVALADAIAAAMGSSSAQRATLRRAGWLHGLGRVGIANAVWNRAGPLTTGEWERVRLAPYWTSRAARQVGRLATAADIASNTFERLDGSGYFRGLSAAGLSIESRILAAAVAWVALRTDRPWRAALRADEAMTVLQTEGNGERFDPHVLSALQACIGPQAGQGDPERQPPPLLTAREREVLRRISLGDSNKEAAKRLDISPSTVRTHLESVFRKLGCRTRAACTLRAAMLGLLAE
jgi:HD-GYP domain-containing protein (c-di-GMP phosphodiesterase class II)